MHVRGSTSDIDAAEEDDRLFTSIANIITKMKRHSTKIENEAVFIETNDGWLEVGTLDDLYDRFGGETYTVEYKDFGRTVDWLSLNEDGTMTFDVRETLAAMDYPSDFVKELLSYDLTADDGVPERTAYFAEFMQTVWDSKGVLDGDGAETE